MKSAVIVFPGINRDRDMAQALARFSGHAPQMVWQTETELPSDVDLVVLPGGFSYGDYLRCGAIAARAPIMAAVRQAARRGVKVLGVCNGFQILIEAGLLPGALMRNASLHFVCRRVRLRVENETTFLTRKLRKGAVIEAPVAHGDGNYFADPPTLAALEGDGRVVFRYADQTNPNGSINDIAGIVNHDGTVIGLMPHPENMIEGLHGRTDCAPLFESLVSA
jgi:phosphoribosylformylglycinamidine synthase subunit PurQ / glutaminase